MITTPRGPGVGDGWARLAQEVRALIPPEEVDGVWVFPVIRREGKDWGTAIISRVEADRRRISTARFVHTVKGKTRGKFEFELEEVGSGPIDTLAQLLALVPKRSDEDAPPVEIDRALWFPVEADVGADEG